MFGREKTPTAATPTVSESSETVKVGGKGRATPSRKEAQARNRVPLVGAAAPAVPKGATREERREAKRQRQALNRENRIKTLEGQAKGDDRYLLPRDKGPVKRYVRDVVDARYNAGEYFLPVAVASFGLTLVQTPFTRVAGAVLLYAMVLAIVVDSLFLVRRIRKGVQERFGEKAVGGNNAYAILRACQMRRTRRPPVIVARGAHP
ncbi:DUF3043 domain-containing protein [Spongisporangium articulatum]|uniref:DUF3043 domain-containing protein n=1 Tax=Spongisporangium articulatum TaxID=3362603 RepID=A0ABW8ASY3_9ACTN